MRQIALFLSLFLLAPLADLVAQESPHLSSGARVRVSVRQQGRQTGTLVAMKTDTLVLRAEGRNTPRTIPLSSVSRLDVSRGRASFGKGALKGAGIGLLVGVAYPTIEFIKGGRKDDFFPLALMFGSLGGTFLGALIGGSRPGEQWEQVSLERIRVGVAPQRNGGVRLAASFTF
jgi:hypothetical protein